MLLRVYECSLSIKNAIQEIQVLTSTRYFQVHPGKNVGIGKDHTIFSLIDGLVKFEKFGPDRKKVKSNVNANFNFYRLNLKFITTLI